MSTLANKENQAPASGLSDSDKRARQAKYGKRHAETKKQEKELASAALIEAHQRIEELELHIKGNEGDGNEGQASPVGRLVTTADLPPDTPALLDSATLLDSEINIIDAQKTMAIEKADRTREFELDRDRKELEGLGEAIIPLVEHLEFIVKDQHVIKVGIASSAYVCLSTDALVRRRLATRRAITLISGTRRA